MKKRHFMATHTWVSDEVRDQALLANSKMSDREFFASLKTDSAETLAHWMGQTANPSYMQGKSILPPTSRPKTKRLEEFGVS